MDHYVFGVLMNFLLMYVCYDLRLCFDFYIGRMMSYVATIKWTMPKRYLTPVFLPSFYIKSYQKHYLVAEYFMTAPTHITPELFYMKAKQDQADLIWKALFIDRMPISEATRGVGM
jgi:hypothetical protein